MYIRLNFLFFFIFIYFFYYSTTYNTYRDYNTNNVIFLVTVIIHFSFFAKNRQCKFSLQKNNYEIYSFNERVINYIQDKFNLCLTFFQFMNFITGNHIMLFQLLLFFKN